MKNKKYLFLVLALLLLITGSVFTYSIYRNNYSGNGTFNSSKWDIKIFKNNNNTQVANLNFGTNDINWNTHNGKNGKIAPGDSGTINYTIDASGSEVDVEYDVQIGTITGGPSGLTVTSTPSEGTIPYATGANNMKQDIVLTVKWEGDINDDTDKDTSDKTNSNKSLSIPVTMTVKQGTPTVTENYVYAFFNDNSVLAHIGDRVSDIGDTIQINNYNTYCYINNEYIEDGKITDKYSLSCYYSHEIGSDEFESLSACQNYLTTDDYYSNYSCVKRPSDVTGTISTDWSIVGAKTMLRFSINNSNEIERVDSCYVHNDNLYCLKGLTSASDPNKEQIYLDNKAILDRTFNNCELSYNTRYSCSDSIFRYISTDSNSSEFTEVATDFSVEYYGNEAVYCYTYENGGGSCSLPS